MFEQKGKTVKVFIKNPEKGKVKTRLAATLGDEEAVRVYKLLLSYTRGVVLKMEVQKEVWYSGFIDYEDEWDGNVFSKKLQRGQDLGERMKEAFKKSFEEGSSKYVVLIGSDCAELTQEILEEAFRKLKTNELVLGPAEDGGYYLIGMSKFLPDIFDEIEWSTRQVFSKTISKAEQAGLNFALLPELSDVDTVEDWEKAKEKLVDD
ncbi:MAG: TIGR04282 family arsenosugar biosynthesis glycosyltransferase [Balneola sp.]